MARYWHEVQLPVTATDAMLQLGGDKQSTDRKPLQMLIPVKEGQRVPQRLGWTDSQVYSQSHNFIIN